MEKTCSVRSRIRQANLVLVNHLRLLLFLECLSQQLLGFLGNSTFLTSRPVLVYAGYDVHRHEANYVQVVQVDYLDYDYEDYYRFGRVEKQLAS